jgi:cytochrome P450
VDRIVYGIIEEHRHAARAGNVPVDLLSMLLDVRDDDTGQGFTDEQLRNETITFLLAGHETTANALTWTFYLLSQHLEAEQRLHDEVRTVLGGRVPTNEDLSRLAYTKMVIREAMRLYPPVWIIERRAVQDDNVGGYWLPGGSAVVICPYTLHRHPDFWKQPDVFNPARFSDRPPAAYIPFGAGQRFCIGNEFAMLEAQLITAMVVQAGSLRLVPGHPVEPVPGMTLRTRYGLLMTWRKH